MISEQERRPFLREERRPFLRECAAVEQGSASDSPRPFLRAIPRGRPRPPRSRASRRRRRTLRGRSRRRTCPHPGETTRRRAGPGHGTRSVPRPAARPSPRICSDILVLCSLRLSSLKYAPLGFSVWDAILEDCHPSGAIDTPRKAWAGGRDDGATGSGGDSSGAQSHPGGGGRLSGWLRRKKESHGVFEDPYKTVLRARPSCPQGSRCLADKSLFDGKSAVDGPCARAHGLFRAQRLGAQTCTPVLPTRRRCAHAHHWVPGA